MQNEKLDLSQPVYLLELGAGTGKFAFLFLKAFVKMLSSIKKLLNFKFCFIISVRISYLCFCGY